ncbi:Prefoldin subunit 6 [Tieghemiomyces parasiticus]|uniref:Prefoldin subunit 6 n=1 Tax=Tieghemiomyces parasiticus TaxID=78921 RepID=A0A9W8DYR0_9FUNG|nr:Prefoldin subunit 6 [Tieghemiomyces parasiticus]
MSLEAKLEATGKEFQKIQSDLSKAVENRQKLESQLQENEIVQKEFKLLKDDANVFKLIGPVLVKQDRPEATANVDKRIEYITAEM